MLRRLILQQGMMLALIGSVIGLAIAFGGTRLLKSDSVRRERRRSGDVSSVAMFLLGRRAARLLVTRLSRHAVDPMIALRAE